MRMIFNLNHIVMFSSGALLGTVLFMLAVLQ